ncbi:hypothetical protein DPMN_086164 [Dreissena polymorpha]|uniref:Uncharacterized protein n=1 Tax=Dreissena polymorpha TaxID=45954 RepID=A0A9D4BK11_DREPO|nr:hypothetical protein DPMN_086164 [Dreissena polymorpha]
MPPACTKQWETTGENALGEKHSRFHAYFYSFYTYAASVYQAMGDNWSQTQPVLSQFDHVQRDDRKKNLSRLKVLKHLSRSTPFQAVHKVRRQFVTRCYYDHSVLTQFEPV